jgi:hypothetical protein
MITYRRTLGVALMLAAVVMSAGCGPSADSSSAARKSAAATDASTAGPETPASSGQTMKPKKAAMDPSQ